MPDASRRHLPAPARVSPASFAGKEQGIAWLVPMIIEFLDAPIPEGK